MVFAVQFVDSIGDVFDPVSDTFTRTVVDGWGTSDSGHVWATSGGSPSDYSVSTGLGRHSCGVVNSARITVLDPGGPDVSAVWNVRTPVTATGAQIVGEFLGRYVDDSNHYRFEVTFQTAGDIGIRIRRVVAGGGTLIGSLDSVLTYTPNVPVWARCEIVGSALRMRVWADGSTEPSMWHLSAVDSSLTSGKVGFLSLLATGNTNALPVVMSYDSLAVTSTTQVRLDLNDSAPWKTLRESDLSPPPLKRAIVGTLLTDGEQIPASAYGNRLIRLALDFTDVAGDDAAAALQDLAREVDRPTNFLRWQPETTHPVYFRTLRSDIGRVQWDQVTRRATVDILAEPFAYGLPETTGGIVVNNNPAAATNGMFFDVSNVKGDVEAPVRLVETTGLWFNDKAAIATRRRGDPANVPFLLQAESMNQLTDTTVQPNDPLMYGAGSNFSRCTFATTPGMADRLSAEHPSASSLDLRGTYRVFVRVRRSSATGVVNVQLRAGPDGGVVPTLSTVPTLLTTNIHWVDMGLVSIPFGSDPVNVGPSGVQLLPRTLPIFIGAERVDGTSTLDFDVTLLVPADDTFTLIDFGNDSAGLGGHVIDTYNDVVYGRNITAGGEVVDHSADNIPLGGLPTLLPGVTNRIYVITGVGHAAGGGISIVLNFDVTHWPRYLYVRPATS